MTEDEARAWIRSRFDVSRETWERLEAYVAILLDEMRHQNLIAESTRGQVWARHIADSAQLLQWAPSASPDSLWVDLGAGAGLPGIVAAILSNYRVVMIEMRKKRVEFLQSVVDRLGLGNAEIIGGKVEQARVVKPAGVISARAYAPMAKLIPSALHLADFSTVWLLPKGQNFENELAIAKSLWHSDVQVERSLTAPESAILKLSNVRPRGGRAKIKG